MAIEAVLWDLDGTLVATHRLYPEAYRRTLARYLGRELSDEEMFFKPFRSEIAFLRHHLPDYFESSRKEFVRHYEQLHPTHFDGVFDGIPEVLDRARERGLKQGIVTGKSRDAYDITIVTAGLGQFDVIVVDDDVEEPKPSPEGIAIALQALEIAPERAIYIGDSITDLEAAIAAGTRAAGVLWGKEGERLDRFIRDANALDTVLLKSPADLLAEL